MRSATEAWQRSRRKQARDVTDGPDRVQGQELLEQGPDVQVISLRDARRAQHLALLI